MRAYAGSAEIDDPKILLSVEKGIVYYKIPSGNYKQATGETEIEKGDSVKTSQSASAKIVFYDTQELILDENTEIQLTQAKIDEYSSFVTKIKINLKQGQIWSRLVEFFHPESNYEVEAGNVVATVRGTSFNMKNENDKVEVAVFENRVGVYDKNDLSDSAMVEKDNFLIYENKFLPEPKSASADETLIIPKMSKFKVQKIKAGKNAEQWIKNNRERDGQFKKLLKEKRKRFFQQVGPLPGSKAYYLKKIGEKLSLTFKSKEEADRLKEQFRIRRFLEIEALIEKGRIRQAMILARNLQIDSELVKKINRIRSIDPYFLDKLKENSEVKNYFFNTLPQEQKDYLSNKVNPPAQPSENEVNKQKQEFKKLIVAYHDVLLNLRNKIDKLQNKRKILLLDLEALEKNLIFETDKAEAEFMKSADDVKKRLFDIEKQLIEIEEKRREFSKQLELISENNFNQDDINQTIERFDDKINGIEKLLEIIDLEIKKLAEKNSEISASSDEQLKLLN